MIGFIILTHQQAHRTSQLADFLSQSGNKVVIHFDANSDDRLLRIMKNSFVSDENIGFSPRVKCQWGTYSLVEAGLGASRVMLERWPEVTHIVQISGSCIPTRPIKELQEFLSKNLKTDFIESYSVLEQKWVNDGLDIERFTLHFPFSWRKQRYLFDKFVDIQRSFKVARKWPSDLKPHLGSQWWCLSASTLRKILLDENLPEYEKYFKSVWIPDEAFFQTLARKHSNNINSMSLTFSKFDEQGKPYIFYDDHEEVLARSDKFFARKIWPGASLLYDRFLDEDQKILRTSNLDKIYLEQIFDEAFLRRTKGRKGLYSQGRDPSRFKMKFPETARTYKFAIGISKLFPELSVYIDTLGKADMHGRVYAKDRVDFSRKALFETGNLPANPKLRDRYPQEFLSRLIWNKRVRLQIIEAEVEDLLKIEDMILNDSNASIFYIAGGWLPFWKDILSASGPVIPKTAGLSFEEIMNRERIFISKLKSNFVRNRMSIYTLNEVMEEPDKILKEFLEFSESYDELGGKAPTLQNQWVLSEFDTKNIKKYLDEVSQDIEDIRASDLNEASV